MQAQLPACPAHLTPSLHSAAPAAARPRLSPHALGATFSWPQVIGRNGAALAVDPAEPDKVLWAAKEQRARLQAVLTTHRHKCAGPSIWALLPAGGRMC